MTEYEVIYVLTLPKRFGKFVERFILASEDILGFVPQAVMLRPCIAKTKREPRMQRAENLLERTAMEDAGQDAVAARNGAEAITVTEAEDLAGNSRYVGLLKPFHSERLEVGIAPDVVIAAKEIDIHTSIDEVEQRSKHAHIAFGNDVAVLIPEIPDVTEQVEALGLRRKRAEKLHETRLPILRVQNVTAEVNVGDEICEVLPHAKMNISTATTAQ